MTFDSTRPGTPPEVWGTDPRLRDLPSPQMAGVEEVVVIGAHPDDETLGAGGLIALCHDRGMPVRIVCVTDGAASHPGDPRAAQTRRSELERAIETLAPGTPVTVLGFPDGRTREHRAEITAALIEALRGVSGRSLLLSPWRGDGHRDHRVVGEIVQDVADGRRVWEYPVWMWQWAGPDHPDIPWDRMVSVPVSGSTKARAVRCFSSQISGDQPMLRADFLENFQRDGEVFIVNDQALGKQYFDAVYKRSDDPWRFRTRWYERRKRDLTLASLPHPQYRRALEIGCSIGMLTEVLGARCEELLAVDISERAVARARERAGTLVDVRVLDVLIDFPEGMFDLIVLSEVGYYWGRTGLRRAVSAIRDHLVQDGVLVACHWRHPVDGYPLTGSEVHAVLGTQGWTRLVQHDEEDFLLEVFSGDGRSVARREGLL